METRDKNIVVVGLGLSGAAAARFLKRQKAEVTVVDSGKNDVLTARAVELEKEGIRVKLGDTGDHDIRSAQIIVLSPGVPHTLPAVEAAGKNGAAVMGEVEMAARFIDEPIVAVTGTNGKTTTTTLIGEMLALSGKKIFVGGNIGTPLMEYALIGKKADVVVAEISSFQTDTFSDFHPFVGVLLNITEDHLDRYPDFQAYARSKMRLFANQKSSDTAVLNGKDPLIRSLCEKIAARKVFFDEMPGDDRRLVMEENGRQCIIPLPDSLPGAHNRENAAAAALAALAAGGNISGIRQALAEFRGLPHRLSHVATINGVGYYDDSKATNTDAVERAISAFSGPIILIMGGRGKGYDFSCLAPTVKKHVKKIIAIGETRDAIIENLGSFTREGSEKAGSLEDAVSAASASAAPGDTVLLSPACASFDMFRDYGHRGDVFYRTVKDMALKTVRI